MKTTAVNNKNTKAVANTDISNGKETKTTVTTVDAQADKKEVKPVVSQKEEPPKAPSEEKKETEKEQQEQHAKFAPNLEETLRWVTELHRKKVQRDRLLETISNLDKFEVEVRDEADETDSNYYQGCTITIEDDNRNKFATKNPVIIKSVALFVKKMCLDRLAEIEAEIALPNI